MKRLMVLVLAMVMVMVLSGCDSNSEVTHEHKHKQTPSLTQTIEHSAYAVTFPQSWKVTKASDDNPTLYFEVEQKQAGGLFLSRFDKLADLPADRKELTELSTSTHQVYQYATTFESEDGSSAASVICFYVPAKNSGYEFVFVDEVVSQSLALDIARTVKIK